jgi:hypothetical protein
MVKCIVKVGTLQFEDGIFQQFDEFTVSAERAALFDPHDVKVIPDDIATVSVPVEPKTEVTTLEIKPLGATVKKTVKKTDVKTTEETAPTVE